MILYTTDKRQVKISKEDFIASGGEGTIYKVDNQIAKIYKEKPKKSSEQKIKVLMTKKINNEGICFPSELLFDSKNNFVGYLMPKASGKTLQSSVFGASKLRRNFPKWTRIDLCDLAITILHKIELLHQENILLGDINPMNIHVASSNEVFFIDTDSYQVDNFPCPVGSTYFVAPEIQHINFGDQLRKKEHEYYAIATLMFMIFFPGKSPYAKVGGGSPAGNIKEGDFSYPFGDTANYKAPKGPWEYIWKELTYELKKTFHLTFIETKRIYRPTPKKWIQKIENYKRSLVTIIDSKKEIFPEIMEKVRDNVSTTMRRDVKVNDSKLSHIKTVFNSRSITNRIGVLELSTKAVKLLLGEDQILIKNEFNFNFFPTRLGVRTNTGDLLDGKNVMDIGKFKTKVLPIIKSHVELAKSNNVSILYSVATAAYRASANRNEIIKLIKKEIGINVKILSKKEEARATLVAFKFTKPKWVQNIPENTIMIDQGGGSTEVTLFNKDKIINTYSISMGTTIITNILLSQTNPNTSMNDALLHTDKTTKDRLNYYLKNHSSKDAHYSFCFGVGTAITKGTGKKTSRQQHGYKFTQEELAQRIYYYEKILTDRYKNVEELNKGLMKQDRFIYGLDARNVLSIRLGLPFYIEILRKLNLKEITVSATSLWYGIYFDNLYN